MSLEIEIKDVQIKFPRELATVERVVTIDDDDDVLFIYLDDLPIEESGVICLTKEQQNYGIKV